MWKILLKYHHKKDILKPKTHGYDLNYKLLKMCYANHKNKIFLQSNNTITYLTII